MRWSQILHRTGRHRPEGELPGLGYLLQSGILRRVAAGIYDFGLLGYRILQRLDGMLRGRAQEYAIFTYDFAPWRPGEGKPGSHPVSHYGDALLAYAQERLSSYKQLPQHMMTVGLVYREEPRPRAGLLRARAFTVAEGMTLAHTAQDAYEGHRRWWALWSDLARDARLSVVEARDKDLLAEESQSLVWLHPSGDTPYLHCSRCGTWAHPDVAPFRVPLPPEEDPAPLTKVYTPGCNTIDALCAYLDIPPQKTAKALFLVAGERVPVIAIVRGDMDLSEAKLRRILGLTRVRPAREEEIRSWGAEPGYGSPVGTRGTLVVVDVVAALTPNLVGGANEASYHYTNLNVGRDYRPHIVADIARAPESSLCPTCGSAYEMHAGWKLASVSAPTLPRGLLVPAPDFMPALDALPSPYPLPTYLDPEGRPRPPWFVHTIGGYERFIAAAAETHHDEEGLRWPAGIAPYLVHLVLLPSRKEPGVAEMAERVYRALVEAGIDVLLDDRDERAGVKFNDADLLGAPVRLTVSFRTWKQNGVELTFRGGTSRVVPADEVVSHVRHTLERGG